ncbi:hypothetical protein [Falsirhodobacter xinxiangensis]|uniref:hypothetical protein n=1 Tax=Falsirhodobacter xinxiangensis TaxID=2530049 RepID=UPI0010AAA3B3|nr:hypothetical protein [Rhodobacter xinxiangensis]
MAFDLSVIEARLGLLAWRDAQLSAITAQFNAAWPALESAIEKQVADLWLWQVAQAHYDITPLAHALIAPWVEEQARIAATRAEDALVQIMATLPVNSLGDHAMTALPALAGVGLIAASVVAVPAVVSYATVATIPFLLIGTTISTPILLAGGAALAALSLTGSGVLGRANNRTRKHLEDRLKAHARTVIFGDGQPPSARCFLNDTQALVLKAGQTELEIA